MLKHAQFTGIALILVSAIIVLTHPAAIRPAWADELDDDAAAALRSLYDGSPAARVLGEKAVAILVFPNIVKAGFLFGAQFGEGTLFRGGRKVANYRSEAASQPLFPIMLLAHVMMAAAFVWIYGRGREARAWLGQGLRFGLAVALLSAVPGYLIYYVVQPLPQAIVTKQIAGDGILMLVLGAVTAFLYRGGD